VEAKLHVLGSTATTSRFVWSAHLMNSMAEKAAFVVRSGLVVPAICKQRSWSDQVWSFLPFVFLSHFFFGLRDD
jgi:hypothetical protein